MKTTILITGATGYLGGRLAKHFLDNDFAVIALALNKHEKFEYSDCKNCKVYYLSETNIDKIFSENRIDIVIHTATLYGRRNEQIIDMIDANIKFPLSVLSAACKHHSELFINTGTILNRNVSPYALTKGQFADWLDIYSKQILCVNLKLDHFYGPNDKPVKFIAWLIQQFRDNVPELNLTEGTQERDFIYIDDVISAFETVVLKQDKLIPNSVNTFEAGSNIKTKIRDMVEIIREEMNNNTTKLNFGAVPIRENEMIEYKVDTSKLRLLGWEPKNTVVRENIKKIIKIENGGKE